MPRFVLAAASSSAPSGSPWALEVPAFLGAPKPITVLQAIIVGLLDLWARRIAASIASGSCPSTRSARQPQALKRATWSTLSVIESGPSIEMPLSSHSTISLLSFWWPASAIASWLMPSIRSPSEAST